MIGMFDHDRSRSMIEEPSRSGSPRSRMMRSGGFSVAGPNPLLGIPRFLHCKSLEFERRTQELPDIELVVDDEGWGRYPSSPTMRFGFGGSVTGRRMDTIVPRPTPSLNASTLSARGDTHIWTSEAVRNFLGR